MHTSDLMMKQFILSQRECEIGMERIVLNENTNYQLHQTQCSHLNLLNVSQIFDDRKGISLLPIALLEMVKSTH